MSVKRKFSLLLLITCMALVFTVPQQGFATLMSVDSSTSPLIFKNPSNASVAQVEWKIFKTDTGGTYSVDLGLGSFSVTLNPLEHLYAYKVKDLYLSDITNFSLHLPAEVLSAPLQTWSQTGAFSARVGTQTLNFTGKLPNAQSDVLYLATLAVPGDIAAHFTTNFKPGMPPTPPTVTLVGDSPAGLRGPTSIPQPIPEPSTLLLLGGGLLGLARFRKRILRGR